MTDEIPRRIDLRRNTPAELAIRAAVDAVEALPADVRLTDAVTLLSAARDSVADFHDNTQPVTRRLWYPKPEGEAQTDQGDAGPATPQVIDWIPCAACATTGESDDNPTGKCLVCGGRGKRLADAGPVRPTLDAETLDKTITAVLMDWRNDLPELGAHGWTHHEGVDLVSRIVHRLQAAALPPSGRTWSASDLEVIERGWKNLGGHLVGCVCPPCITQHQVVRAVLERQG